MLAVSVAPLLRRELAHVFTLRTECHPEVAEVSRLHLALRTVLLVIEVFQKTHVTPN